MKSWQKGIVVALIHIALVSTLGAKLLYDRATRPRVWVKTMNYDPNLPIRGRYVALSPIFDDPQPERKEGDEWIDANGARHKGPVFNGYLRGHISVVNNKAVVALEPQSSDGIWLTRSYLPTGTALTTVEPILYFISDTAENPTTLKRGDELWVEVTIPKQGPPRPIQLAVKSGAEWRPLNLK